MTMDFIANPLGEDIDGDADFGADFQHGKEMMRSLCGAWKSQLMRWKAEIDPALGDLLEGLKGFWFGISQKTKLVGCHNGGWHWASKCKPKIQPMSQPKSPEIGATSPKAILILATSLEVALLPVNAFEEI
jgi:hypothetical protein